MLITPLGSGSNSLQTSLARDLGGAFLSSYGPGAEVTGMSVRDIIVDFLHCSGAGLDVAGGPFQIYDSMILYEFLNCILLLPAIFLPIPILNLKKYWSIKPFH